VRKTLAATLLFAAMPMALQAAPKPIERYKAPGPGPVLILQGALVPAGNDTLYLSGQVPAPVDPKKSMTEAQTPADFGDTKTQTISVLTKIKAALEAHGYKMSDVIHLTVYVVGDPAKGGKMDFAGMNEGFKQFFGTAENPNTVARSALQVAALANPGLLVEIEATAAKPPAK
jgi:2-iminobutanoate/2-iminopropanoate deaminase